MLRLLSAILCFLFVSTVLSGQCRDRIVISSQEQFDTTLFCDEMREVVVTGDFRLNNTGQAPFTFVEDLIFVDYRAPVLPLEFYPITLAANNLVIDNCPNLEQFTTASINLDSLTVINNQKLFAFLHGNRNMGVSKLNVENNPELTTIDEFGFDPNEAEVRIVGNPKLQYCCFVEEVDYDNLFLEGNGEGCSTIQIITEECDCERTVSLRSNEMITMVEPCLRGNRFIISSSFEEDSLLFHTTFDNDVQVNISSFQGSYIDLSGLQSITQLTISNCEQLETIILAPSAHVMTILNINDNPRLKALSGFDNIIGEELIDLRIVDNRSLDECCFVRRFNNTGIFIIEDNGNNCQSYDQILEECLGNAFLRYFLDDNQDGVKDFSERYLDLPRGLAAMSPMSLFSYIVEEREQVFRLSTGVYEIVSARDEFDITLPANGRSIIIDEDSDSLFIEVGVIPNGVVEQVEISVISPQIERCSFTLPLRVKVSNTGNVDLSGQLFFNLPDEFELVSVSETPLDSTLARLEFEMKELDIYESDTIDFELVFPSADFVGDIFCLSADFLNDNIELGFGEHCFNLRCAVDPNDKHGTPFRGGEDNYTLFDESLDYTIRFENLGNDTAFNIRIEDQLSPYLDLSTFRLISASHDVTSYEINDGGLLNIFFNNILLPSKEQDTIANKGYVHFTISPLDEIDEFTPVENTAGIFFDFNEAVITNTTLHTFVSEIPMTSVEEERQSPPLLFQVYPVPAKDFIYINNTEPLSIQVVDLLGSVHLIENISEGMTELDVSELNSGVYLIRANNGNVGDVKKIVID